MSRVTKGNNGITRGYSLLHKAVDIGWKGGGNDYVLAHSDGKVVFLQKGQKHNTKATGNASYGNCVKIKHDNGYYTLYAHMKNVAVKKGQKVKKGQSIGYISDTGKAFGKHLHFEVRNTKDKRINPTKYINADLPNSNNVTILYQVYDNKKKYWLPNVKIGSSDYAGNKGNPISAVYIDKLEYRVYDNVKRKYLPWVKGRNDYAGNIGNPIGGIQIKNAKYRVHIQGGKWLNWVDKVDNTNNGYAGIKGKNIDAIQIRMKD